MLVMLKVPNWPDGQIRVVTVDVLYTTADDPHHIQRRSNLHTTIVAQWLEDLRYPDTCTGIEEASCANGST